MTESHRVVRIVEWITRDQAFFLSSLYNITFGIPTVTRQYADSVEEDCNYWSGWEELDEHCNQNWTG